MTLPTYISFALCHSHFRWKFTRSSERILQLGLTESPFALLRKKICISSHILRFRSLNERLIESVFVESVFVESVFVFHHQVTCEICFQSYIETKKPIDKFSRCFEVLHKLCEIIIMEINQKHLTDPEGAAKMNSFLGI